MTILNFPPILGTAAVWGPLPNSMSFRSPTSKSVQTRELAGQLWSGSLTRSKLNIAQRRALQVFLLQLRGQAGRFYFGDPFGKVPHGPAGGAPSIKGGGQTGTSLAVENADPGIVGWMTAGDYIAFDTSTGRELKQLVVDADTDAFGETTLSFEPPIRNAPADGTLLIVRNATCVMKLVDDQQSLLRYRRGPFAAGTLNMEEAYF